jgi:hypothetical protein
MSSNPKALEGWCLKNIFLFSRDFGNKDCVGTYPRERPLGMDHKGKILST